MAAAFQEESQVLRTYRLNHFNPYQAVKLPADVPVILQPDLYQLLQARILDPSCRLLVLAFG